MINRTRYLHLRLTLQWILLFIILESSPHDGGSVCNAQRQNQRFLVNFGADFAEVFSKFPSPGIPRLVNPILSRTTNQLVADKPLGPSGRSLLSNNYKRTRFLVYNNKRNWDSYFELELDRPSSIPRMFIPKGSEIKILIHGYNSDYQKRFPQATKNAYLLTTNNLVIAVDWRDLATPMASSPIRELLYIPIVDNISRAGLRVHHLIEFLMQNGIITNLKQVHLVGHSLGVHVAGYAGHSIQQRYGTKVGRITGLDPAGPLFRNAGATRILDETDADFVDVIHTSPTGLFSSTAHIDFYPNGGQIQPHCLKEDKGPIQIYSWSFLQCNHLIAYDYFAKSILEPNIVACGCNTYQEFRLFCKKQCTNRAIMGEYVNRSARGKFFLDLNL